jgi:hypothetical protein
VTPEEQGDKNKRAMLSAARHTKRPGRYPFFDQDRNVKVPSSDGAHVYTVQLEQARHDSGVLFFCDHLTQSERSHREITESAAGVTPCWHSAAAAVLSRANGAKIDYVGHRWEWVTP